MKPKLSRMGFIVLRVIPALIVFTLVAGGAWLGWSNVVQPMLSSKPAVAPTSAPIAQAATAPVKPTTAPQNVPTTVKPNVVAQPTASGPEFVVAFDAFATYDPVIIAASQVQGINLKLVPFGLDSKDQYSEQERTQMLTDNKWDAMFTTFEKVKRYPKMGKIIYVIDETAGSDAMYCVGATDLNSLKGKKISYSDGSISEFFTYWPLDFANLGKNDVKLMPKDDIDQAVDAFMKGEVDCVVGWSPNVDKATTRKGATLVVSSARLRVALDVVVVSNKAAIEKPAQVYAFLKAFVKGSYMMWDNPEKAAKTIAEWDTTGWTGITDAVSLKEQMSTIAPATFQYNTVVFGNLSRFESRLDEAGSVLKKFGVSVPDSKSVELVDARFVTQLKNEPDLVGTSKPQNASFNWIGQVDTQPMTSAQQAAAVKIGATTVYFPPEGTSLSIESQKKLDVTIEQLKKFNGSYFEVAAMAAHPKGDFTRDGVLRVAAARARAVADYLIANGIPENRIIFGGHQEKQYLGALESEHPQMDESQLTLDRKGVLTVRIPATDGR